MKIYTANYSLRNEPYELGEFLGSDGKVVWYKDRWGAFSTMDANLISFKPKNHHHPEADNYL